METRSIQLPFCGFYESEADYMIENEIESVFATDDGGCNHNIPSDVYYKADHKSVRIALVKAYVDAYADWFEGETGIALNPAFEEMTSPREYNFETDRVFISVSVLAITAMFEQSEADNHKALAQAIKDNCTSYDGFWSFYNNDLGSWLLKPVLTWDHNELKILLEAVLSLHTDSEADIYDLLDSWRGNGGLSDAVWTSLTPELQAFADLQREHGKALDYDVWQETGAAWSEETGEPMPPLRCKETIEMTF